MKKLKIIILSLIVVIFLTACGNQGAAAKETEQEKLYGITVYTVDWNKVNSMMAVLSDYNERTSTFLEKQTIENNTQTDYYQAREIVSYSETNVRFINLQGKEMFISGDKVIVSQWQ